MATKKKTSNNRTRRTTRKERLEQQQKADALRREIVLWAMLAVCVLLFISNFGIGGIAGQLVSGFMFGMFGLFAYLFPLMLIVVIFLGMANKENPMVIMKLIFSIVFVVFLCVFMSLVVTGDEVMTVLEAYDYGKTSKLGGGFVGGGIASVLIPTFGKVGAYVIDIVVLIISLILITGRSAMKGVKRGSQIVYESAKENTERYMEYVESKEQERKLRREERKVSGVSIGAKVVDKEDSLPSDEMEELHSQVEFPEVKEERKIPIISGQVELEPEITEFVAPEPIPMPVVEPEPIPEPVMEMPVVDEPVQPTKRAYAPKEELSKEVEEVSKEIKAEVAVEDKPYVFPPISLLKPGEKGSTGNTPTQLRETAEKLEQTLKTFGVNVTVTNISCGPSVTRYEIQPEMGVKVSKIVNLADDIKLNLAAADIRIEAPIPGKAAVGIEVPNNKNVIVAFRDLIESQEFATAKSNITFAVGKDISGKNMVHDIAKMPHVLIAGATGSGKSICINTIVMSILYKADPRDVKLIMIDPKVVELSVYNGIPHLMIPVVTDPKKAAGALNWAVAEMTERYQTFAKYNVRKIEEYNAKIKSVEVPEGQEAPKKMPYIVIIVDELADLMMVASKDVEDAICRLAQLARAAGIHLVIATQRPSVNVITGLIKANMPSRIAFAVSSGIDSRTILDMNGAEKLLGKGDMLFNPQGVPKPIRVQGAFVSDQEVSEVVRFVTEQNGGAVYSNEVQEKLENMQASSNNVTVTISDMDSDGDGRDSYFKEAASIIIDKEKASIGMLQRYLKVGFNRAARIMDQLEEAGIVGPEEGTKPRKVLMSQEEFETFIDENP